MECKEFSRKVSRQLNKYDEWTVARLNLDLYDIGWYECLLEQNKHKKAKEYLIKCLYELIGNGAYNTKDIIDGIYWE